MLRSLLYSYIVQDQNQGNGITHTRLGLPTSIKEAKTIPTDMFIGQFALDNPLFGNSFQETLYCGKLKIKTNITSFTPFTFMHFTYLVIL